MRSKVFWRLVVVFSMVMLATGIIGVHRIPSFMYRGLDPGLISIAGAIDAVFAPRMLKKLWAEQDKE